MKSQLRFIANMSTLGLALATPIGCGNANGEQQSGEQPTQVRKLTQTEIAQLRLPPGVTVVGALPTVEGTAASSTAQSGKLEDVQVGGGGGTFDQNYDYSYIGFSGRGGRYVDQIRFDGATQTSAAYGGTGGTAFGDVVCPITSQGQLFMVGIIGRAGTYVDAFGALCGTATTTSVSTTTVGGNGGTPFNYRCDLNTWIVGWWIRHGTYVDQLTALCGTSPY